MYSENFGFGPGVLFVRGTIVIRGRGYSGSTIDVVINAPVAKLKTFGVALRLLLIFLIDSTSLPPLRY